MSENELSLFEKLYPIVYQCFYNGKNKNKIIKTRLPEYSEDSFIMPNENQSRQILKDRILMLYSKDEKELIEKIKISKECKYRSLTYKILPLLHDRFYHEWENSNVLKEKSKELKKIDDIVISDGILLTNKPFNLIENNNKLPIFIVINGSKNKDIPDGIYSNTIFKIGYIVDEKIKVKFSTYINIFKIECEENNNGEIVITNKDSFNMDISIFLSLKKSKEYRKKYIEKEIDILNKQIDIKNEEIKKLQ